MSVEEILEHYGVKGMKWGQRKRPVKRSTDAKTTRRLKKKSASELTNKQLKKVNERLRLEANYKNATASKGAQGKKVTLDILGNVGKTIVTSLLVAEGTRLARRAIRGG